MDTHQKLPALSDIKAQLKPVTVVERWSVVLIPLLTITSYFVFASLGWNVAAFLSLIYLSFATYGSCCHDLVHGNVGLSREASNFWLSFIEFFLMRSGTTYRKTHLNHHTHYPDFEKDPEGRASYYTLFRTLLEGLIFHPKLIVWMFRNGSNEDRIRVGIEVAAVISFYITGILLLEEYPALFIYQVIVTMGAWIIPLITSYLVHEPYGKEPIHQTKVFRGRFFRILALDHLYHLEHHLYPQIPHCRWKKLALILNPYFKKENLTAIRLESKQSRNFDLN